MFFSSPRMILSTLALRDKGCRKLVLVVAALLIVGSVFPSGVQAWARAPNFTLDKGIHTWADADHANQGLIKNGYQGLAYISQPFDPNHKFNHATVYHYLRDPYSLGLYITSHGDESSQKIMDGNYNWITVEEIAHYNNNKPWRFVFLDSCYTGKEPYFAQVFGIPGSTPQRAFLGWKIAVKYLVRYRYTGSFFHYWGPRVRIDAANFEAKHTAIKQCWQRGWQVGFEDFDIALYGDGGYDGGAPL